MSDHDTACTCDRCRMMVMPTTRTASESVLHEWSFASYVCRIVETEPGIVHFEQAQESTIPLAPGRHLAFNRTEKPMGDANEIIHLSLALRDVEAERDRLKVELVEAEEAIRDLTDSGDAMRFSMPTAAMAGKAGWDASRRHATVRRALERGK